MSALIAEETMNININVKDFGPIAAAEINLRPLTIFVGESNTGKTYLFTLIYALHQHFQGISKLPWSDSIAFYLRLYYGTGNCISPSQHDKVMQERLAALEKLTTPGCPFKYSDLPHLMQTHFDSNLTENNDFTNELQRCFDLESISKLIRFSGIKDNKMRISLWVSDGNQTFWEFEAQYTGSGHNIDGHINSDAVLLNSEDESYDLDDLFTILLGEHGKGRKSYYLPAARSGIMLSHDLLRLTLSNGQLVRV